MRVLLVTNTYPPADISGVGALVYELAAALAAAGHEPRVVTRQAAAGDRHALATGGAKLIFPLAALRAWWRESAREVPDLVHVHESDGAMIVLALRLARGLGLARGRSRLVATLQVSYRRERRAVRAVTANRAVVSRPTSGERAFGWLRAPLLALLGRLSARLADRVVAPSAATARELAADYGARHVAVIPNGVSLPETPGDGGPPRPAGAAGRPVVLYAGRLRTRKAVAVLVEAFARVRAELPGATLVLLGDGEQRPALAAQVARLGLGAAVRFAGAQPRAATPAFYRDADLFCLPSTYEGFPVAILEAMAHGLPVVATTVAGIPEAVADGATGRLVPPEDAAALAAALVELGRDPELARRLGAAGRQRVVREFTRERVAALHLELFAAAIAAPR